MLQRRDDFSEWYTQVVLKAKLSRLCSCKGIDSVKARWLFNLGVIKKHI